MSCGHCVAACPHDAITHSSVSRENSPLINQDIAITAESTIQLLKTRRSIRAYKKERVPQELIARIIDVTCWAPSAGNNQPVHWLVITNIDELHRLAGLVAAWFRKNSGLLPRFRVYLGAWDEGKDMILRGAPHLAVLHALPTRGLEAADCAIAITYFELAAYAYGLGTCWAGLLTEAADHYPPIIKELKLPEGHRVFGAVMFGYPEHRYQRIPPRKEAKTTWR